ncbi:hypothetical protein LCGC14_1205120 [marine sediment metagenome]|uniref:Uncharacterized protein n=1 Tax=marine sediment metagenome TaxID=412755 RepID=A0A0F9LK84_9ZZZZ
MKFFKPSIPQEITNLNWVQSKKRFPLMKPYGDADKDGLKNFRDCKPFDWKRKGDQHDEDEIAVGFEHIKDLETVGDVKKLEDEY